MARWTRRRRKLHQRPTRQRTQELDQLRGQQWKHSQCAQWRISRALDFEEFDENGVGVERDFFFSFSWVIEEVSRHGFFCMDLHYDTYGFFFAALYCTVLHCMVLSIWRGRQTNLRISTFKSIMMAFLTLLLHSLNTHLQPLISSRIQHQRRNKRGRGNKSTSQQMAHGQERNGKGRKRGHTKSLFDFDFDFYLLFFSLVE